MTSKHRWQSLVTCSMLSLLFPLLGYSQSDKSTVDYYTLTPQQLQNVPPGDLELEVSKLKAQNAADTLDLKNIKAYNQAMCSRYLQLLSSCPAMYYISTQYFVDDFNCSNLANHERETKIQAKISGDSGPRSYVLEADDQYRSTEFSSGNLASITFSNIHSQAVKPPRFGEIKSLVLKAVAQGTGKNPIPTGQAITNASQLNLTIYVNGKMLLPKSSDFALYLPGGDNADTTFLRVNPQAILQMRKQPSCLVSTKELMTIYQNSQSKN